MEKNNVTSIKTSEQKTFVPNSKDVPIQQIASKEAANEKNIEEAVEELNPDQSSMESRG